MDLHDKKTELSNPIMKHCLTCNNFGKKETDKPCIECLDTIPIGRKRPLWQPKQRKQKQHSLF